MAALGFAPEPVRGIGVLRLHGGGLRSILATPATEPLVVGSCLVGSAARGADPTTERGRGRVAMPAQARALQAAGRAVELIAVDRPESLSASATGLHRSGSSSLRVNRGEKFLCGGSGAGSYLKNPAYGTILAMHSTRPLHLSATSDVACRWSCSNRLGHHPLHPSSCLLRRTS
jgi:hypothetical protein